MIIFVIAERFAEFCAVALSIFFMYRVLDAKINRKWQIIAGLIFIVIRMSYYATGLEYRPYFSILAGIIYGCFVFSGRVNTLAIWSTVFVVIDGIVDSAIISAYLLLPDASITQMASPGSVRIILLFLARILLFVICYLITMKTEKNDITPWQDSLFLLIAPIGCLAMVELVFRYGDMLPVKQAQPLMSVVSLSLLIIVTSVIALYNRITVNSRELARSKLQLRMSEMTQEHINQINDIYSQLSSIRHDLRNHFLAIKSYIEAKDFDALKMYFDELDIINIETTDSIKHPVLNALISTRAAMAEQAGIVFESNILLPEALPINDVDLCILISNILDNAFESNEKVPAPRFITLNASIVHSYWAVACRNATNSSGNFRSSGSLKSTKEDTGMHGIGTKQIQEIAEKTGGFVTYKHENFEFSTLVMLKLTEGYSPVEYEEASISW